MSTKERRAKYRHLESVNWDKIVGFFFVCVVCVRVCGVRAEKQKSYARQKKAHFLVGIVIIAQSLYLGENLKIKWREVRGVAS